MKTQEKIQNQSSLKIIPLGGLHEVGKNTCVFEINDEILIVDAGLAFPSEDMHGVNIILPDITYLEENQHKIKGMIVTHGHEDHIGGIAFHLRHINVPVIYGPRLALASLKGKLEEAGVLGYTELKAVGFRDKVKIGSAFQAEFIRNTHSIPDSFTIALTTPVGAVIFTGDFKVDHTPIDGEHFDLQKLAEYGEKGVLCLLSDSTNSEVPGFTPSESNVFPNLDRIFGQASGRLIVATFATSVHRINIILQLAQKHDRTVYVVGRGMLNMVANARMLGYIKCEDSLFKPIREVSSVPDDKALILTTGAQGEVFAGLTRMAKNEHRQIKIRSGDTIVYSSHPIPGNTLAVNDVFDKLLKLGANVVYGRDKGIHVSGHGSQEDQKLMLSLTRPKFFIPVHGEHRMLAKHAEIAQSMGLLADNILIIKNGDVVELSEHSMKLAGHVKSGIQMVDASRLGMVSDSSLIDRQSMAQSGAVIFAITIDKDGQMISVPDLQLLGISTNEITSHLKKLMDQRAKSLIDENWSRFEENGSGYFDWDGFKSKIESELFDFLSQKLKQKFSFIFLMQKTSTLDKVLR